MFNLKLSQWPLAGKTLVLLFLIITGYGYILSLLNVNYSVGLSYKAVVEHYHPAAAAGDEFGGPSGPSFADMVRGMHFHVVAHSMLFFILGLLLLATELKEGWKAFFVGLPFLAILLDTGSMVLTRFVSPVFAIGVILGGMLMAGSFALGALIVLQQTFLKK